MIGSYFIGAHVLNFFGVSLPVVQVGGGLVVISMGWGMLMEREESHDPARKNVQCSDASIAPLWISPSDHFLGDPSHDASRLERLPLLRIRRSAGTTGWNDWNDRDRTAHFISAGLHRRADHMERR